MTTLHLRGPILTGPDSVCDEAWIIDDRISFEPPESPADDSLDGWVVPGLVDAHCHVGLSSQGAVGDDEAEMQALTDRNNGTLALRDAGSPADTRWMDDRDDLPRMIRAGRHIARTKRYLRGYAHEIEPDDLTEYVLAAAEYGDGWVKIVGDWIDRGEGDLRPCWPDAAVHQAIAAAHQVGAKVTAHCFGEESLVQLANAGIDCIEHACGLTDETIDLLVQQRIAIVPTLINIETFPKIANPAREKFPAYYHHMLDLYDRRYHTIGAAKDAGIEIFAGTDAGGSIAHGRVIDELCELTKAGFTPQQALDAGCWAARRWLGFDVLDEGSSADLLVVPSDPRLDLDVLRSPSAVFLRGQRVVAPSVSNG